VSDLTEVDGYLQQLQWEGELHSQGRFTLDPGRNREKMAEFLRQDRVAWSYWMARLGVLLECCEARIQLGRNGMMFELEFSSTDTASEVVARFLERGEDGPGIHYLRAALLWSQALCELVPELQPALLLQRPEQATLGLDLRGAPRLQRQEATGAHHRLTLAFLSSGGQDRSPLFESFRHEFRTRLPSRLAFCPVPVRLEGPWINSGRLDGGEVAHYLRYYLEGQGRHHLAALGPQHWPATTYWLENECPSPFRRPRFSRPRPLVATFSLAGRLPEGIDWTSQESGVLDWVDSSGQSHTLGLRPQPVLPLEPTGHWPVRALLQRDFQGLDQWTVVQHGVLLDWEPLPLDSPSSQNGWRAVVGLDTVQTDLSGLRAVHSPRTQELREWLQGEVFDIHNSQALVAT